MGLRFLKVPASFSAFFPFWVSKTLQEQTGKNFSSCSQGMNELPKPRELKN